MKTKPYVKEFETEDGAHNFMVMKNKAFKRASNFDDMLCLVPGPSDNFAVVDIATAIDLGLGYECSYSGHGSLVG